MTIPHLVEKRLMPICRDCNGTGQREIKKEVTTVCPDCHGSKQLSDGTECKRCDKWGQVGTGKFNIQKKLCQTCLGSGKVTEGSLTTWFLLRVVPATLVIFGGGAAVIWATLTFVESPLIAAIVSVLDFGGWGVLMSYFIRQMPRMGEISPTNWFLIRAIPTTVVALGVGIPLIWVTWLLLGNAVVTAILALVAFAIWGTVMYYFISHMPE